MSPADLEKETSNDTNDIKIKILCHKFIPIKPTLLRLKKSLEFDEIGAIEQTDMPNIVLELWRIVSDICNKMYESSGGMLYFHDIININKMIDPIEIEVSPVVIVFI